MVVFACNTCGEALKKNQVENHLYRARCRNSFVSCMDCTKDFDPVSYKKHIKCITEDEKYSGGKFKPKDSTLNGERKREAWMEIVQNVCASAAKNRQHDPKVVRLLQYLAGLQSVPAKKKTYINFLHNSCTPLAGQAETVWNLLEKEKALSETKQKPEPPKNPTNTVNDSCNGESKDLIGNEELNGETEEPTKKKKNKNKKTKDNEVEKNGDQEVPDANQSQKVKKRKRSKSEANDDSKEEEEVTAAPSLNEGSKKLKKKKQKQQMLDEIVDETDVAPKKKKKDKSKRKASENGDVKTKKKRKHVEDAENGEETVVEAVETETVSKKRKKRKRNADTEEQEKMCIDKKCRLNDTLEELVVESGGKFNWSSTIEEILKSAKHTRLPMKKLNRKVFAVYKAKGGDPADKHLTDNKVSAKFDKMLRKMQNVTIDNESVRLVDV